MIYTFLIVSQVVELDYTYQTRVMASQIRAYFYGTPLYLPPSLNPATAQLGGEATTETTLSPFSITLDANDLQIYRIGDGEYSQSKYWRNDQMFVFSKSRAKLSLAGGCN